MNSKNILILGGGIGGIVIANQLRKKIRKEYNLILIDKNEKHVFYPSLLWLLFGQRSEEDIQKDFSCLKNKGIEFVQGEIEEISVDKNTTKVNGKNIDYKYLVISLGAQLNKNPIKTLTNSYDFYSLEGIRQIKNILSGFSRGRVTILIAGLPFKCPAAPYELAFLLDSFFRENGKREKIDLTIYTPETLPMPTAGPDIGNMLKDLLIKRKIGFYPEHKFLSGVGRQKIIFENKKDTEYDLLLYVPLHTSPEVVKNAGLTNETGWIPVQAATLKTKHENVFAIGDIAGIKLPGQYRPDKPLSLPKAGVFAHSQAKIVAESITAELNNKSLNRGFTGNGSCFLEMGDGIAGFATGNFYALPYPQVKIYKPSKLWHIAKILFEKWWLWKWF